MFLRFNLKITMESPKSTKSGQPYSTICTPKATKKLYWPKFSEGNSPKMCGFPETQEEFGWDDSPEPLKLDPKLITGYSKKRIDCRESPVSSHCRKETVRPRKRPSPSDDNDLARIQELSRQILAGRNSSEHMSNTEYHIANPYTSSNTINSNPPSCELSTNTSVMPSSLLSTKPSRNLCFSVNNSSDSCNSSTNVRSQTTESVNILPNPARVDATFRQGPVRPEKQPIDSVLQSFFHAEEDDDLLSQIDIAAEMRETPNKSKFTKSLSDNQLESPSRSTAFRRSASFQTTTESARSIQNNGSTLQEAIAKRMIVMSGHEQKENNLGISAEPQPLKKQKSFHNEPPRTQTQCSLAEIEKKRLEAKYRREIKEIERKKLEAQKRLNERRARVMGELVKR